MTRAVRVVVRVAGGVLVIVGLALAALVVLA